MTDVNTIDIKANEMHYSRLFSASVRRGPGIKASDGFANNSVEDIGGSAPKTANAKIGRHEKLPIAERRVRRYI
jgi:hypothetical protein